MPEFTTDHWETAIAEVRSDDVLIRGRFLTSLIGSESFAGMAYRVLTGRDATPGQAHVLEAVMVSCMEHGISPSTTVTRMLASYGVPIQAGLAAGVLTVGDFHGGAGEQVARDFQRLLAQVDDNDGDRAAAMDRVAVEFVKQRRESRLPVDGFGHPQHGADPRVDALVALSLEHGVFADGCRLLEALTKALEQEVGRRIPANIDGISAALILDLDLDPRAARAILIAPRIIGLAAHFLEEIDQGATWRHVRGANVTYTGEAGRE